MLIYNQSVEGSSHKISGTPCQDFSICKKCKKYSIVALSDGHGSKTYVRSNIGSKLACEIALSHTERFIEENYSKLVAFTEVQSYSPDFCTRQNILFENLFKSINSDWEKAIAKDSAINPFTPKERSLLGTADLKHAYGCTLMVGVKSVDFTFIFHIGDGRIFTISSMDEWEQPVPWDKDCVDNITTSLCEDDPVYRFRYYFNPTPQQPFIIFLCSDGIEDCYGGEHDAHFQSEELIADYSEVLRCFLQDNDFKESCVEFLASQSKRFSHDDMSIAFIIDDVYDISHVWLNLISIKRTLYNIEQTKKTFKSKINNVVERINLIKKNINRFDDEIERLNGSLESVEKKIQEIDSQILDLSKCNESGKSFKSYIEEFPQKVREYEDSNENNNAVIAFLKKLTGYVFRGLSKILGNIQTDILENEKAISRLSTELNTYSGKKEQIGIKSSEYSRFRENELEKLTKLEEELHNIQADLDDFEGDHKNEYEEKAKELEAIRQKIRQIIPTNLQSEHSQENMEQVDTTSLTSDGVDKFQTLNICRFSSQGKDEDITIHTDGETFNVIYNGGVGIAIGRDSWKKLVEVIKSIDKASIISQRTANCIVISVPDKMYEKCISLDTKDASDLWNVCLSLHPHK